MLNYLKSLNIKTDGDIFAHMKTYKTLVIILLISTILMSITGSTIHFHRCFSTGDFFVDFHFLGQESTFHKNCYSSGHLACKHSVEKANICCESQSECCLDIRSKTHTDDYYIYTAYNIKFQSLEFKTLIPGMEHIILTEDHSSINFLSLNSDNSPPKIITTRILIL